MYVNILLIDSALLVGAAWQVLWRPRITFPMRSCCIQPRGQHDGM